MNARTLSDDAIRRLSVDALNSGLRCYRPDLRYSRADALRAAELWNASKAATCATVATVDRFPVVLIMEREPEPPASRPRAPYLFRDVPRGALFEHGGALYVKNKDKAARTLRHLARVRVPFHPLAVCMMSHGEARGASVADVVPVLADGVATLAPYREDWTTARARGRVVPCRFVIHWRGRWRRLYADRTAGLALPHFVTVNGERVAVEWVRP